MQCLTLRHKKREMLPEEIKQLKKLQIFSELDDQDLNQYLIQYRLITKGSPYLTEEDFV